MLNLFKKRETHIDFMRQRNIGFALSALLLIISAVALWKQGLNYGIEFTGGISVKMFSDQTVNVSAVREKLSFLPEAKIQTVGKEGNGIVITSRIQDNEDMNQLLEKIKAALGPEFADGTSVKVTSEQSLDVDKIREKLSFLPKESIQTIGNGIIIKSRISNNEEGKRFLDKIKDSLGSQYQYEQNNNESSVRTVGSTIGKELKETSLLASIFALLAISVYIWFRFEWPFAIGCLLALAHDMIIVVGAFALFQWEFDMIVVAGLLSLAGYDCNDSIVTYDRIRENLRKFRKMPIDDILNRSINETLSRTILTSVTTLFVVLILLFVGGDTLRGFSITMTLGVILGTYSSICIAVPLLRYFDVRTVGETAEAPKQ